MSTFSKRLFPILGLLMVLLLSSCGKKSNDLTVVFPKLGAADCAILMTEDHTVVIDAGEVEDADTILDVLSDYHRDTIDLLLISHYDKDHVGGAAELIDSLTVRRVIGSSYPKESEEYAAYQIGAFPGGTDGGNPQQPGTRNDFGRILRLNDLPAGASPNTPEDASNNASVAVAVQYRGTRMLFTGDAMEERTEELLSEFSGSFDLIKLPASWSGQSHGLRAFRCIWKRSYRLSRHQLKKRAGTQASCRDALRPAVFDPGRYRHRSFRRFLRENHPNRRSIIVILPTFYKVSENG